MSFDVEILAHSVAPGCQPIMTMMLGGVPTIPHYELLRHRGFSFAVVSTRAVPGPLQIDQVEASPAMPIHWGKNRPGMQAGEEFPKVDIEFFREEWDRVRSEAVFRARRLDSAGLHKQVIAWLLLPWKTYWMVVTGCWPAWANFYTLRCHASARPEMRCLAVLMARLHRESVPEDVGPGGYHLPYTTAVERAEVKSCVRPYVSHVMRQDFAGAPSAVRENIWRVIKLSVARTGRVSFDHHGIVERPEEKDLKFFDDRLRDSDFSVFEHVARAPFPGEDISGLSGNLPTWVQLRQTLTPNVHSDFPWETLDRIPAEWCKEEMR